MMEVHALSWGEGGALEYVEHYGWTDMPVGPDYILMQCTGLKDSKGTEIYEGDVIRTMNADMLLRAVVWHEPTATYHLNGYPLGLILGGTGEYEVVGNIYENPELLK